MNKNVETVFKYPMQVLRPIREYLKLEKRRLVRKKKELRKEDPFLAKERSENRAASDIGVNEQIGHERVDALRIEVEKALINIKKSLTRIKVGKYGLCEKCGNLIDTDRLAINPTASKCMKCENE